MTGLWSRSSWVSQATNICLWATGKTYFFLISFSAGHPGFHGWETLGYTCQLFLKYRHEIFILGVLGFLKTTQSFPNIPEEVQSLPKTSVCDVSGNSPRISQTQSWDAINVSSFPVLFTSNIRSRGRYIVIYSFYMWFSFLTWV